MASIAFNLVAKLPSFLAVLIILPRISSALGVNLYGELLSMLALGATFALFFGGISTVGRRRLSLAHAVNDSFGESTAALETVASAAVAALFSSSAVLLIASRSFSRSSFLIVAILPIFAAFLNTFDNLRAAYNEHYVTAIFQVIFQLAIYCPVLIFGVPDGAILLSAMILLSPFILASIMTCMMLIWRRPELIRRPRSIAILPTFKSATFVVVSDGAIFATLNLGVYFLGAVGAGEVTAWYGTLVRLFQTLLSPTLLIVFPLTSFVALCWPNWPNFRRLQALYIILFSAIAYGCVVGAIIAFGGAYYLETFFSLSSDGKRVDLICIGIFFGAVVAQKVYTLLIYSIAEGRLLSIGTFAIIAVAIVLSAVSYGWYSPFQTLDILSVAVAVPLVVLLFIDQANRRRRIVS